jgi:hypothetical protein
MKQWKELMKVKDSKNKQSDGFKADIWNDFKDGDATDTNK